MKEYIIIRDTDNKITKVLNKWRHEFHIEIISVLMDNRIMTDECFPESKDGDPVAIDLHPYRIPKPWGNLVVMLTREKKYEIEYSVEKWEKGKEKHNL